MKFCFGTLAGLQARQERGQENFVVKLPDETTVNPELAFRERLGVTMSSGDIDVDVTPLKGSGSEYSPVTEESQQKEEGTTEGSGHGHGDDGDDLGALQILWNSTFGLVFNTEMYVALFH